MIKTLTFLLACGVVVAFSSCRNKGNNPITTIPDSVYRNAGNQIVALTFDSLRNSLITAIGEHGMEEAISFCNTNALQLTKTYADSFNIKRTSLRYRNAENKPDSLEKIILTEMTTEIQSARIPGPRVVRKNQSIHYFKPIIMQEMCLNCHGKPGVQITPSTGSRIKMLYPDDQAINFRTGDLRGVWHIVFKAPQQY